MLFRRLFTKGNNYIFPGRRFVAKMESFLKDKNLLLEEQILSSKS